jgi:HTH-type transcriptional regulator, transcriptional repressor of NAD biosynthesis genes
MPLHEGHIYLLHFARMACHRLTIMVCSTEDDPIPGPVRYKWVKEMFPACNVVHQYTPIQQEPKDENDGEFWAAWLKTICNLTDYDSFDVLFGSEDYCWRLAQELSCEYIPVNRVRSMVSISATDIRTDPMKNWDYIPVVVRPYFARRIRVVGPMSAGKSTLTKLLSYAFKTAYVEEYARSYFEDLIRMNMRGPKQIEYEDLTNIARGQMISEDSTAYKANRLLFCDTDLLTTFLYSRILYGNCEKWIEKEVRTRKYHHTFVLDPRGVPFVQDGERINTNEQERVDFFNSLCSWLEMLDHPFTILNGDYEDRRHHASVICKEGL